VAGSRVTRGSANIGLLLNEVDLLAKDDVDGLLAGDA
jgi:hypothetical protein